MKKSPYTDPALRSRVVAQVKRGTKGGPRGVWTARKAQIAAAMYESRGGGYRGPKTKVQRSLTKWTGQNWGTKNGEPSNRPDGMARYLPRKVWDALTPAEAEANDRKKREGSRAGKARVANTRKVRTVMKKIMGGRR